MKRAVCVLLALSVLLTLSGCSLFKRISGGEKTLRVGVENIAGTLNPFYCNSSADEIALAQIFEQIQYQSSGGKLVNGCGSITYEENGASVKYTVSINRNMMFSDGTNVTIDDVIFFYHFIADATYDGTYADWYLNDIKGLKEYYYDDADYAASVAEIDEKIAADYSAETISEENLAQYLAQTSLEGAWSGELDSDSPYGKSWREYLVASGYEQGLEELGASPSAEELLKFVAQAQAQTDPSLYDCEQWWRARLLNEYKSRNYADGINVADISGIKKVNDYACTIEFNSHNISAISSINVPVVSKSFYSKEYQKGSAPVVREINSETVGSGKYTLRELDKENGVLTLVKNQFYSGSSGGFDIIELTDLAVKGENPAQSIANGTVDVIEVSAEEGIINGLDPTGTAFAVYDRPYYSALFFNTKTLESGIRCAISCLDGCADVLKSNVGSYYTLLYRSMSMRFYESAPANLKPYYTKNGDSIKPLLTAQGCEFDADGNCMQNGVALTINLYCSEGNDTTESAVIDDFSAELKANGIGCTVVRLPEAEFYAAVRAGEADMWFDRVYDGATPDEYEYYHSSGAKNYTGISDAELDAVLLEIRQNAGAVGYGDLQTSMLDTVAKLAVEMPLYQRKNVTVFNTKSVDSKSIPAISRYSGMKYSISQLEPVK